MSELPVPVFVTYPKSKFHGLLLNKKKAFEQDASNFNLDKAGQRLDRSSKFAEMELQLAEDPSKTSAAFRI